MEIRRFRASDIRPIVALFYETVHFVNKKDYTQEQLDAWASKDDEAYRLESWREAMGNNITFVALMNGGIVGFSDMTIKGHVDRLYVHKDFQGQGIASALLAAIESEARKLGLTAMDTDASITAQLFFKRCGYQLIQMQTVERKGIPLVNFKMIKMLR